MYRLIAIICLCLAQFTFAEDPKVTPPPNSTFDPTHEVIHDVEEFKAEPDSFMTQLTGMLTTIGILIGLILFFTWLLKKLLNNRLEQINSQSPIRILETRNISPKTAIHIVDVNGKQYVLAESVNGVTYLGEGKLPPPNKFEDVMNKQS